MKIKDAISNGFILGEDGFWRKPIFQLQKDGVRRHTWQKYEVKKCIKCGEQFLASHRSNLVCSLSCSSLGNRFGTLNKGVPRYFRQGKKIGFGTTRKTGNGYIEIYLPNHAMADVRGRVLEHRFVMSEHLQRYLDKNEFVHHINGDRSDNRLENLVLLTKSSHNSHHKKEEVKTRKRDDRGKFI